MIAGLKPYPAMKDSGVPWLGEVPAHWECCVSEAALRDTTWENVATRPDQKVRPMSKRHI